MFRLEDLFVLARTSCAFRFLRQLSRPSAPRPAAKSGKAVGRGVAAVAIATDCGAKPSATLPTSDVSLSVPLEQIPYSSDTLPFIGGLTRHELPLLPPLTTLPLEPAPKNVLPELPMNWEVQESPVAGKFGFPVKMISEGVADKFVPTMVADVPDPDVDNDHDTRVDEVTLHESQLSTMSPVTVVELI